MYLCNDASIRMIADEVRAKAGTSQTIPFMNIADMIRGLVVPVDRGSPSAFVTSANPVYQIQRGKYSGGSVSVVSENVTAVLSKDGGYAQINNVAASVTVPASDNYKYAGWTVTPGDNSTSLSITDSRLNTFQPQGVLLICTQANYKVGSSGAVLCLYCAGNNVDGSFTGKSGYKGKIASASVSYGSTVTISNIAGTRNGTSVNCFFRNVEYSYFVWGK